MSSITVPTVPIAFAPATAAFTPSATRRGGGSVRLTRRGRAVFMGIFLLIALGLMIGLGGWAVATRDAGTPEPVRVVEVMPGDTLYDIAGEIAAPGEVREMVYRIRKLNSLPSGVVHVGQKLAVPIG